MFLVNLDKIDVTMFDINTNILRIFLSIDWCIELIKYLKLEFWCLTRAHLRLNLYDP